MRTSHINDKRLGLFQGRKVADATSENSPPRSGGAGKKDVPRSRGCDDLDKIGYFFQEIPRSLEIFLARKSSTSV